ncbi:probable receptor kinase At1g11050 [Olea europaea subsp. europaea]|uniref:non-specific serine/threonine protein kinase n=1 Tax=Olea europaea subsp. europaea TaxID=158383 RepID=A0A8S0PB76_OLEEU|nr:probable receptor kinase At1g11050 [Olea europaea subsp. europaea]
MGKSQFLPFILMFFYLFIHSANSSCPIDFNYVETFPWDTSLCHEPVQTSCCQTLRSVFGMGLAQYLKESSMFYLPTENSSSSCIANFQEKLSNIFMSRPFFSSCFNDTSEFVNGPSNCAGITTTQDWIEKVGSSSLLDSSCNEDLTGLTRCSLCLDAGMQVTSFLVSLDRNSSKCFYFTIFYAAAVVNDFGPEDPRTAACVLGLPLATSISDKKSNHWSPKTVLKLVFGLVGAVVGIFVVFFVFMVYRKWDKQKKQDVMHEQYVSSVKSRILPKTCAKWFHITELEQATNGFSQSNMIGQGGYGIVYKGTLSDGTEVAIKLILDLDTKGDDEFINEAQIISKIRHRNLLSLRGFCVASSQFQGTRRYLVYDFMSNGSLDDHLFKDKTQLSWPQRKNIILEVAKGLAYLHYGIKPAIYHRDIKATNILLDDDMKARVADFGLAKQSTEDQSHLTTRVAGTYGYLAPEYALYGQLTEKSDAYSFGIVILEIMSGRRVLDATESSRLLITDWVWDFMKSGKIEEIFHKSIRREGPKGVMERFVRVGILCAHVMVALRPTVADALKMLEGDIDIPRLPDRPLPLSHESFRSAIPNNATWSSSQYSVFNSLTSGAKSSISSNENQIQQKF